MKAIKNILFCVFSLLIAASATAQNYLHLSLGALSTDRSVSGFATDGTSTIDINEEFDDSGAVFGVGYSLLSNSVYFSVDVYFPNTDEDTWIIFEASPHYMLSNNAYAGVSLGYQKYESGDSADAQSIGANQSDISLDGITAGLSFGVLFKNGTVDLNFKFRFVNGDTEKITGTFSGVDYAFDLEVDRTMQVTLGYNFSI